MPTKVKFWIEMGRQKIEEVVSLQLPENYTEEDIKAEYQDWVWDQVSGSWEVLDEENQSEASEEGDSAVNIDGAP